MDIVTPETWYRCESVGEGVTHIVEPHVDADVRCNMWHVRGRDRDLLVDSGMGVVPLRRHVALLCARPVLAVASHTHFDHIGAHHEFEERAVHRAEAAILAAPGRAATLAGRYVSEAIFTALPPGFDPARYEVLAAPATRLLEDGELIDLGDRVFEVLHLPGHSPGGIALWEPARGLLFSGDTVYDGPLLDDIYHSDIEAYVRSMRRLRALPVRVVHGGHYPSFGRERYLACIDAYLRARAPAG